MDGGRKRPGFRVLTYNVRYEGTTDGPLSWEARRSAVVSELRRLDADVLALQELWLNQLPDLRERLTDYEWVAESGELPHTAIAYRPARFALVEGETFWLSEPDAEPGAAGWDATYQRRVTRATLRDRETERPLAMYSVHLDHEGDRARREGIGVIRDRASTLGNDCEVVVAGDLNAEPGALAYERAVAVEPGWRSLHDAARVASVVDGPGATYTGFGGEDDRCLDHVLVSDRLSVDRFRRCVPSSESSRFRPSDHRPVLAELRHEDPRTV